MTRHLAIGDIHGCFDALQALERFVGFREDDVIVTLGDYVDRGPKSCHVLDWLLHLDRSGRLRPLRGNHEIIMVDAFQEDAPLQDWFRVGGDATLRSYSPFDEFGDAGTFADVPDAHWDFLTARLLPYYETDTHFFVHANAYPDLALDDQPGHMLYWERFDDPPRHESGKIMICGHTSQSSGIPVTNGSAVCIDTCAYGGGWLSCLHVESGLIWQANERGETRRLWLEEVETV
ncbi:MAG: serine/threonine protein phosphatase [Planctomycetales bacterium]|nr:serine/threonine protein phosphatase [Planctomycetales bacterium]